MILFLSSLIGTPRAVLALLAALFAALVVPAASRAAEHPALRVIIDASASMEDQLADELKYKLVRRIAQTVLPRYDNRLDMGLIAFGYGDKDSCQDVGSRADIKPLNGKTLLSALDAIKPKGMSPIATALAQAVAAGGPLPDDILLIADGGDNCGGNVCAVAASLATAAPQIRIHVIGLGGTSALRNLSCVSSATKGSFALINNPAELESAIERALQTALIPLSAAPPPAAAVDEPPAPANAEAPTAALEPPPLPERRPKTVPAPAKVAAARPTEVLPPAIRESRLPAGDQPVAAKPAGVPSAAPAREELEIKVEPEAAAPLDGEVGGTPAAALNGTGEASTSGDEIPLDPALTSVQPDAGESETGTDAKVRLLAFITDAGEEIRSGAVWRVYKAQKNEHGHFDLLKSSETPRFESRLPIGTYLVNLSWGRSHLTEKLEVPSAKPIGKSFVLNAGGLRLSAQTGDGAALPVQQVTWRIYSEERDQSGNRQLLIDQAPGGKIIRLNAGIYHVESLLGTANGMIEADLTVEAGKLTDATVTHTATQVTFKLVNAPGGEALAGATWRIRSSDGGLIKETGGALPSQILAAGDYLIEAQFSGRTFARRITIEPGDPVHVEIVIQ